MGAPPNPTNRPAAGYSGTALVQKLGFKLGMKVVILGATWSGLKIVIRKELR
jgi:hypothetical protein